MLRTSQDQTYAKINTYKILHQPESPDSLYQIHSCIVPDEEVEIPVFVLFFLFRKAGRLKVVTYLKIGDWRREGVEGQRTTEMLTVFYFFCQLLLK